MTESINLKAGFESVETISKLRGRVYAVKLWSLSVLLVPMYHPATILYNPKYRTDLESDFDLLKAELKKQGHI